MLREILYYYLLISGGLFFISTAIAMYRFTDVFSRLHAASKCLTGGSLSLILAIILRLEDPFIIFKLILAAFFLLLTNPIASHALARAAYAHKCESANLVEDEYKKDLEELAEK